MNDQVAATVLFGNLNFLARAISSADEAGALVRILSEGARSLLPFSACALALQHEAGWTVWRATVSRPQDVERNDQVREDAAETLDRFLQHGRLLRIDDLLAPPWTDSRHRTLLWRNETRSALLVPLMEAQQRLGTLAFTSPRPHQFPESLEGRALFLAWMVGTRMRQHGARLGMA